MVLFFLYNMENVGKCVDCAWFCSPIWLNHVYMWCTWIWISGVQLLHVLILFFPYHEYFIRFVKLYQFFFIKWSQIIHFFLIYCHSVWFRIEIRTFLRSFAPTFERRRTGEGFDIQPELWWMIQIMAFCKLITQVRLFDITQVRLFDIQYISLF